MDGLINEYVIKFFRILFLPFVVIQTIYNAMFTTGHLCFLDDKLSDFFVDNIGVLQNEIMSSLTFSLYVNDCNMEVISDRGTPIKL